MSANQPPAPRRRRRRPVPWAWLGLGVLATAVLIFLLGVLLNLYLSRTPEETALLPPPTIIRLTAPPSPTPSPTSSAVPPTPIPTFTPIPTPNVAVAPETVTPGFYAAVANTDGLGVTIRNGPSTNNLVVTVAEEGVVLFVLEGPEEGSGFEWWQVRLDDGTEGWAAANFLAPAAAPNS